MVDDIIIIALKNGIADSRIYEQLTRSGNGVPTGRCGGLDCSAERNASDANCSIPNGDDRGLDSGIKHIPRHNLISFFAFRTEILNDIHTSSPDIHTSSPLNSRENLKGCSGAGLSL